MRFLLLLFCAAMLAACGGAGGQTAAPTQGAAPAATAVTEPAPTGAPNAEPTAEPATTAPNAEPTSAPTAAPNAEPTAAGAAAPTTAAVMGDPNATIELQEVAGKIGRPVFITNAGDGSGRLFVVEKNGTIAILRDGQRIEQPFIDITSLVDSSGSEQGLLGLAFHPDYANNGRFFVYYTASNGDNTVARYQVSADPDQADPASATVLFAVPDFAANHNGGMLAFGPDGYLYAGLGDGGGGGDPQANGQNRSAMLGKLLRLDVDGSEPYAIPRDNPFAADSAARGEIWAYGLRNPWRFSFDRATGDLYIADVGQNQYEEINFQPAGDAGGENYGWNIREAATCFRSDNCQTEGLVDPVHQYDHSQGCSVTGGYVYRGAAFPQLQGHYIYGDYCSGIIWSLMRDAGGQWQSRELLQSGLSISSFGEDEAGELYVADLGGALYQVVSA
jgi:glucose/arabinose dehydrogenase